jgi:prepilin-type processing-associated H-X9-DG protein
MSEEARIRPTGIKAPYGARELSITWADGHVSRLPHELLRGYCPCAGCQGHSGEIRFHEGGNLELRNITQVGNYALGLAWGDAHDTGIYSFRFLRSLGDMIESEGAQSVKAREVLPRLG